MENKKMICAICGEEIKGWIGKMACHPRAIHKWLEELLDDDEFTELGNMVSSRDNTLYVHEECRDKIINRELDINALHLPWFTKEKVKMLHAKMKPYSEIYGGLRKRVYERQNHKCYKCGCDLEESSSIIRRIDTMEPRTEENACLVCNSCNEHYANFTDMKKMQDVQETPVEALTEATAAVPVETPVKKAVVSETPVSEDTFSWNDICEQLKVIFSKIDTYEEKLQRQQKEAEMKISKIQHDIEKLSLDEEDGLKTFRLLKECLLHRRHIEDELEKVRSFRSETSALGRKNVSA